MENQFIEINDNVTAILLAGGRGRRMENRDKGLVELVDGDFEVIDGLTVKVTNGPSLGHQIVLVERGSEKVAYVSDLIPTPYHLPLPYIPAMDEYPNETLVQKRDFQ